MIKRIMAKIARRFTDHDWLYDRRRQEVIARRHTQQIVRQNRVPNWYEDELIRRVSMKEDQDVGFD